MDWRAVLAVASHVLAAPQVKEALRLSRAPTSKSLAPSLSSRPNSTRPARTLSAQSKHPPLLCAPHPKLASGLRALRGSTERDARLMAWFEAHDASSSAPKPMQ
eukprot:1565566-Rhodomonas_salina.1